MSAAANLIGEQRSSLDDNLRDAAAHVRPSPRHDPGARLTQAARRIGGEAGAVLAQAIHDVAVDPERWPVDAMVAMLHRSSARQDAEVDRLIANLSYLRGRIDAA